MSTTITYSVDIGRPDSRELAALPEKFQRGVALHQAGQLDQAQLLYDEVLRVQPAHFDALHLSGVIASQRGNPGVALQYFEKAMVIDGGQAAVFCNMGSAFHALRQFEAALASYDRAIALQPELAEALSNRGNVLQELKLSQQALSSYSRAIAVNPRYALAYCNRGSMLVDLGSLPAALADFDQAIALAPELADAWSNRANVLTKLGRFAEAVASYDRAIQLKPEFAEAYSNRSHALREQGLFDAALASCSQALALRPTLASAHCNRGNIQRSLAQMDAALASYDRAIECEPGYADAHCNRGNLLREVGRLDAALGSFDRAIDLNANLAEAHFSRSIALLLAGDYAAGWPEYEWRWQAPASPNYREKRVFRQPLWLGDAPLEGRTILLHAEQGFGDTLQCIRYVGQVADLGAKVVLEVHEPLLPLLTQLRGVAALVAKGARPPDCDYHCPLLSLPLAFRTTLTTIPAPAPLRTDATLLALWQSRLGSRTRPRVGLAWSGSTNHPNDRQRSIALSQWSRFLPDHVEYVSLQKDVRGDDRATLQANPRIRDFGSALRDFSDTAALCACMDLVVSVDTSVAHLSASLGRNTWILLPCNPDWRWLLDRTDSPWYPGASLHRQQYFGVWEGALAQIRDRLFTQFPAV